MRTAIGRRELLVMGAGAAVAGWLDAPAPAAAQSLVPLSVGMGFHDLAGAAAWIARDRHGYEKYGLNVTLVSFQGGGRAIAAIVSGDAPISLMGGSEVINARSQGLPVQMIAGLVNRFLFDFVVAKHITSPAQLKGTKGAISNFGATSEFAARYALTKLGVNPNDVTLLQTGNETSRLQALQSGQIQFTVLTPGLDHVAFDLGYKPLLRLYDLEQPYAQTVIGANTVWAKTHGAVIDVFLKAIVAASVYLKNPLNVAANLAMLHTELPVKEDLLRRSFQLYRERFYTTYPLVAPAGVEFILREQKRTQPAADFYDNSYVQALMRANFAATVEQSP
jgi:NitT/TauT family transport system substrate-binding protein